MLSTPFNKTKIVATLGPSVGTKEKLIEIIKAGVDVMRLNASHGSYADLLKTIDLIREINNENGTNISILLDLQGPKIRIGKLEEPYPIKAGDIVELCTTITEIEGNRLPMELDTLAKDVKEGDTVLIEDGKNELRVLETNGVDVVKLIVINGSSIGSKKGVNLPYSKISLPCLTDKDMRDIQLAFKKEVDWIALSFVRTANDVLILRQILNDANCKSRIIAKIEKPEALEEIDDIITYSDGIMVARGDLGVEIPIEDVPFWQKKIVQKCAIAAKPVIVATQMLDSMIENPRPTRAEATDVANAVLDGADAVMLSGETSTGKYPIEAVSTMQRIIAKAEDIPELYHKNYVADPDSETYNSDVTCMIACKFAHELKAKAIIGMTRSGYTAFQLAKRRPEAAIYIFTDNLPLLKTINLVWGVKAFYYTGFVGTNQTINDVIQILKNENLVSPGDIVINTASMPMEEQHRTNMVKYTIVK